MLAGPFTAATPTVSRKGATSARTRSSSAKTATIAPPSGSWPMSRPRAAMSRQRVVEVEDAGHRRGDVLADRVPRHRARLDPPRPPELRQAVLDREQRGLRVRPSGARAPDLGVVAVEHVQQRRREHAVAGGPGARRPSRPGTRARSGRGPRPIPGCCAPWPVNTKATCGRRDASRWLTPGGSSPASHDRRLAAASGAEPAATLKPVREASSPDLGRPRHVGEPLRRLLEVLGQALRLRTQRGLVAARHGEDLDRPGSPARDRRAGAPPRSGGRWCR